MLDGNNIWYGIYIKHNWHILEKIIFDESTKMLTEIFNISSWIAKIKFLISFQKLSKTNKYGLHKYKVFYSNPFLVTQN